MSLLLFVVVVAVVVIVVVVGDDVVAVGDVDDVIGVFDLFVTPGRQHGVSPKTHCMLCTSRCNRDRSRCGDTPERDTSAEIFAY